MGWELKFGRIKVVILEIGAKIKSMEKELILGWMGGNTLANGKIIA